MTRMRAYYSQKMADMDGTILYRGVDGSDVCCSTVSKLDGDHGTKWDDIKFVGLVEGMIARKSWGRLVPPRPSAT